MEDRYNEYLNQCIRAFNRCADSFNFTNDSFVLDIMNDYIGMINTTRRWIETDVYQK